MSKFFKTFILLLALVFTVSLVSCKKQHHQRGETMKFVTLCRVGTTPVKNQGNSDLCWLFGMLGTIESEHIMRGDSVNLSPEYVFRKMLVLQGTRDFLARGKRKISLRGMAPMLIHYIDDCGVIPYDSYFNSNRKINYPVLVNKVEKLAEGASELTSFSTRLNELLDKELGPLPGIVAMGGMQYTPREFAHSVCTRDEYMGVTSFTHHPFGLKFCLEVPDNAMHDSYLNVPIDTLMERIEQALFAGHPVCWEGDISEPGFDWARGTATLLQHISDLSQDERQHEFETRQTTDDHVMVIVGMARDLSGREYFIMKNSWGASNAYKGYMFMSTDYARLKTVAVVMTREAWGEIL
ncbi:MAG: C1 family peptidase [Prevotella sp.]|jgi:bleomycin hydrolase